MSTARVQAELIMMRLLQQLRIGAQAFARVVIGVLFLVFTGLPIQFVDQFVDRCVHVFGLCLSVNIGTSGMQRCFCSMSDLFHRENDIRVDQVFEMSLYSLEFVLDKRA